MTNLLRQNLQQEEAASDNVKQAAQQISHTGIATHPDTRAAPIG